MARNLLAAFGRVGGDHDYCVTAPAGLGYDDACASIPRATLLKIEACGLPRRWCWETYTLPRLVSEFQPDVIFNMANRGLIRPRAPQATLIQNPHLFYPPRQFGKLAPPARLLIRYHRHHLARSLTYTGTVFCQTRVARERLRQAYGNRIKRIVICPNQVSEYCGGHAQTGDVPDAIRPYTDAFKLFVLTRYYPHKNLESIPRLFRAHPRELEGVTAFLTIGPDEGRRANALLGEMAKPDLAGRAVNLGRLPQAELPRYYHHTDALFLPTLLESFSGTYVEAMSYDKPILTSDMDFAREVCGDRARYFDPLDMQSMCKAILALREEQGRAAAWYRGPEPVGAGRPSWDEIAGGVLQELERLAQARPGRIA